ncbi:hypothetical protein [Methanimicrococcus hongohii]|uniref:hypothetical protein n=1 Tax=Methanimicrococcus hongohii TaxID=3028295 RepID=UPI00292E6257|nr:hypothetical protein [Methanimicrococcus sp. Hf6]
MQLSFTVAAPAEPAGLQLSFMVAAFGEVSVSACICSFIIVIRSQSQTVPLLPAVTVAAANPVCVAASESCRRRARAALLFREKKTAPRFLKK